MDGWGGIGKIFGKGGEREGKEWGYGWVEKDRRERDVMNEGFTLT